MNFWTIFFALLLAEITMEFLRFGVGWWLTQHQLAKEKELAEEFKKKLRDKGVDTDAMEAMMNPMADFMNGNIPPGLPTVSGNNSTGLSEHGQYL